MLEANYAIKSGRKTFSQVGNEWRMKWKNNLKIKESMYESWLKH